MFRKRERHEKWNRVREILVSNFTCSVSGGDMPATALRITAGCADVLSK